MGEHILNEVASVDESVGMGVDGVAAVEVDGKVETRIVDVRRGRLVIAVGASVFKDKVAALSVVMLLVYENRSLHPYTN